LPNILDALPKLPQIIEAYLNRKVHQESEYKMLLKDEVYRLRKMLVWAKIIFTIILILFIIQFILLLNG